ncbi:MAG: hypothetical protein QOJ99_5551 [Bryobacterales bacterium]|nr:hypothetical protein [Bryobacterales bacterium]
MLVEGHPLRIAGRAKIMVLERARLRIRADCRGHNDPTTLHHFSLGACKFLHRRLPFRAGLRCPGCRCNGVQ